jgi:hypothetical protein
MVMGARAVEWRDTVMSATIKGRKFPESQYLEIKLEGLAVIPEYWISRVLAFLEISFSKDKLHKVSKVLDGEKIINVQPGFGSSEDANLDSVLLPALKYVDYIVDELGDRNGRSRSTVKVGDRHCDNLDG